MSGLTVVIAAFVVGLIAFSFVIGAPIFAVPVVIVAAVAIGLTDLRRRRQQAKTLQEHREEAQAEGMEFTARDKRTLAN